MVPLVISFLVTVAIVITVACFLYCRTDYYKQTKNSFFLIWFDKGKLGEYHIWRSLRFLEGEKIFLFNAYLPREEGTTEVDVIMLHETGVYVFESKNYGGWIFGTDNQRTWTQTFPKGKGKSHKEHFFNPIMQNELHLKWLRKQIQDTSIPMYSYIVFSNRCVLMNIKMTSNDGRHRVLNRRNVLNDVYRTVQNTGKHISAEKLMGIYDQLYPFTQVSKAEKVKHVENIQAKYAVSNSAINDLKEEASPICGKDQPKETLGRTTKPNPLTTVNPILNQNSTPMETIQGAQMEDEQKNLICPRCGGKLIKRTASKGAHQGEPFWGCFNYPKCRYITK